MKTLKILLLAVLVLASSPWIYADDENNGDKQEIIPLNPGPTPTPSTPKAPSYINLSAVIDRSGVTITSNVDVMAQVQITGSCSGVIFDSFVALAPSFTCAIPAAAESLTICVTIGDTQYVGYYNVY